jgi:hypothetical protein
MISNDVEQIASCTLEDWTLVTPEVEPVSRDRNFGVIATGELSHATMVKQVTRVRVYGDVAVVTGRGQNTGSFQGKPIRADEWITDVYRKTDDLWLSVPTHLTPAHSDVGQQVT